jgi:Cyclic nucleotide-binding domain
VNPAPDPLRLFGPIPWRDVRSLAGPVVETEVEAGAELIAAGDVVATFTLIRSGTVELRDGSTTVATLGPGDWFGESDPAARRPQPYTVIARSPLRILTFSAFGIDRLCAAIPDARRRIEDGRPGPGGSPASGSPAAAALPERGGVEDGDRPVVGGHPAELPHQPQGARDRLPRRPGPARQLVLG